MALKQKPAWDVSSSGIMNGVIRVPLKLAGATPGRERVAACGRDRLLSSWITAQFSLILRSRSLVPIACRLPLRTKQFSKAKPLFPRGNGLSPVPALTAESHTGHAFAVLCPNQFGRRSTRRHARRPRPLEVVAAEPAGDIDRLADEI